MIKSTSKTVSKVFLSSVLIGMTLFISGCDGKKAAKEEIEQKGITYNIDSFAEAIASKNTDVINLFIKAGIDASSPKVLGAVIESNDPILLEKLLDEDLNPNSKITTDGSNAPLLNKIVSSPEMLKVLLETDKLYINAQDNEGNTALMQAMIENQPASVTLLVTAGADVNMRNKGGEDAHTLAAWDIEAREEVTTLGLLKALGKMFNANANFDNTANVKAEKIDGFSLLHYACKNQLTDLAYYLVQEKANINGKEIFHNEQDGYHTPWTLVLSGYTSEKKEAIANMLLDNGANIKGSTFNLSIDTQRLENMLEQGFSEKLLIRLGASKENIRKAKEQSAYVMAAPAATEEVAPAADAAAVY